MHICFSYIKRCLESRKGSYQQQQQQLALSRQNTGDKMVFPLCLICLRNFECSLLCLWGRGDPQNKGRGDPQEAKQRNPSLQRLLSLALIHGRQRSKTARSIQLCWLPSSLCHCPVKVDERLKKETAWNLTPEDLIDQIGSHDQLLMFTKCFWSKVLGSSPWLESSWLALPCLSFTYHPDWELLEQNRNLIGANISGLLNLFLFLQSVLFHFTSAFNV